jgi:hypothetical protein
MRITAGRSPQTRPVRVSPVRDPSVFSWQRDSLWAGLRHGDVAQPEPVEGRVLRGVGETERLSARQRVGNADWQAPRAGGRSLEVEAIGPEGGAFALEDSPELPGSSKGPDGARPIEERVLGFPVVVEGVYAAVLDFDSAPTCKTRCRPCGRCPAWPGQMSRRGNRRGDQCSVACVGRLRRRDSVWKAAS